MKENLIIEIKQEMCKLLNNAQMKRLDEVLQHSFYDIEVCKENKNSLKNNNYIQMFLESKKVEGCSNRSIMYYKSIIENMKKEITIEERQITTNILREYLSNYTKKNNCSNVTLDNIRRVLSSYFSWLEDENYILKSPVRRIHKIKTAKKVKDIYSDETLEIMRDKCLELRDIALIDMLASTGIRVGELVKLNINDIDFIERQCVVFGKGNKEREVYFDARTKIHLQNYLKSRTDDNKALFVTLLRPFKRLNISGVEIRLRKIGKNLNIENVHPHRFRRTLATKAIDKGMPIEQVQQLLGHQKIDTTLQYAMVNQSNVKASHKRYISY